MTIDVITRKRAVELTGFNLPYGMRWYQVSGLQFFPRFGDWKLCVAGESGLQGVIGKHKQVVERKQAA